MQDHHNILTGFVSDDKYFHTRSFMIRYQEEEVEINDMCHFRIQIPIVQNEKQFVGQKTNDVYFEVELMFSDLQSFGGPDKFQQSSSLKEITDKKLEFKPVSMKKY